MESHSVMEDAFSLGLDFGTNSVRCVIVRTADGAEAGQGIGQYKQGEQGILLDLRDPDLARQHPSDYLESLIDSVHQALENSWDYPGFSPEKIIGIGIDATGSTLLPLDRHTVPLAFQDRFKENFNAMAWLWKDHTSHNEALEITRRAWELIPNRIRDNGGVYSPEWFLAKVFHCLHKDPEVFQAAAGWAEISDWIPGVLTGINRIENLKRNLCAAGHKALFDPAQNCFPPQDFFDSLDERLLAHGSFLYSEAHPVDRLAGYLTEEWAQKLKLPAGVPVAMGALDGHTGAIGAGVSPGGVGNIFGTSSVLMTVLPGDQAKPEIPGICGVVYSSILPGFWGIEAGQAATGDLFRWWVDDVLNSPDSSQAHFELSKQSERLRPGESGLLALDWNHGNRCLLVDPRLSGLILGQSLKTTAAEIYRALVEATAFGARMILDRFREHGVHCNQVINAGGIPSKNPFLMQVYADITGCSQRLVKSTQTSALGAAICGAVAAGSHRGGYDTIPQAQQAMCSQSEISYVPCKQNSEIYDRLFLHYRNLHDAFGVAGSKVDLFPVMKDLLEIRDSIRKG